MIEVFLIFSVALNAFLLYRYVSIWLMYRKETRIDKEIETEYGQRRRIDCGTT